MKGQFSRGSLRWGLDIVDKYPDIYITPNPNILAYYNGLPLPEDFCNLRYGFEFESGWKKLVLALSQSASNLIRLVRYEQPDAYIRPIVFKEKFGELRWQGCDNIKDVVIAQLWRDYVSLIESRSLSMCEICGNDGELRSDNGWLKTLCDKHWDERINKKEQ